ncbi:MAG: hypothetical protein ACREJO_10530 [Phycisphaerales bacterium]
MLNVNIDPDDARAWLAAAQRPDITDALEAVYLATADAIEARGPACWASGRCCNFAATGHLLFVTGLEAAYCLTRLPREQALTRATLDDALARGGCPFQIENLCGVHAIKPLGCRVYFCDHSAQLWQNELSERMLEQIRSIHARHALPYLYGEWRGVLGGLLAHSL